MKYLWAALGSIAAFIAAFAFFAVATVEILKVIYRGEDSAGWALSFLGPAMLAPFTFTSLLCAVLVWNRMVRARA